jgi:hypothetical protein
MNNRIYHIVLLTIITALVLSCFKAVKVDRRFGSVYDRNYSLPVLAEAYPEFEWNSQSKQSYSLFLEIMNKYYYKLDYDRCNELFYDVLDIYQYDARVYVRLAESIARTGDSQRAMDVLRTGGGRISGFSTHPGVNSYMNELSRRGEETASLQTEKSDGILSKAKNVLLWLPKKIGTVF